MSKNSRSSSKSPLFSTKSIYAGIIGGALVGLAAISQLKSGAPIALAGLVCVAVYSYMLVHHKLGNLGKRASRVSLQGPVMAVMVMLSISLVGGQIYGKSFAWHPKGHIAKAVQNVTQGGQPVAADTQEGAVVARPGDILSYTISVSNIAENADQQYNDLAFTQLADSLPEGVELVSSPTTRELNEDLGTILPGNSVVKMYEVKVTETQEGSILRNMACYSADSVVRDNPQQGCDEAYIVVRNAPVVTPADTPDPTPPADTTPDPTPTTDVTPEATPDDFSDLPTDDDLSSEGTTISIPTQLPNTGPGDILIVAAFAAIGGFIAHEWFVFVRKSRGI